MQFLKDLRYAVCFGAAFGVGASIGVLAVALTMQLIVGLA